MAEEDGTVKSTSVIKTLICS